MTATALLWRPMAPADLPGVMNVAAEVHPGFPEDEAVFAERLVLSPAGCLSLAGADGGLAGYVVSHPWPLLQAPALNSRLGAIPPDADAYYIHDLALLPRAQGSGAASRVVALLEEEARKAALRRMALIAVNRSAGFWQRHGFRLTHDASLDRKLASYDDDARYMTREL
ncbi:GNAT family N-acetyltransferase [Bosea sp. (in: a-proteobacteria)]|uniref:GNAT family N-acetyltransferase n=1 Tax=Bosea sp. (in: a-proteobacteria) TaxID=1871050 RepID=UPI001AC80418|nr:GNAT family N-acetyltransferase [Bosea sp. (in: a-proteobacteria)]MBN9435856.1 GNAT family N-acetyltransferase [Bosea sp. (in: a-proteobacteria)]